MKAYSGISAKDGVLAHKGMKAESISNKSCMKNPSLSFMLIVLLLCLLCALPKALSLGISPVRTVLDFESGKVYDFTVKIKNDGQDVKITLSSLGDLASYIHFNENEFSMTSAEAERLVKGTITLPLEMKPGNYKVDLTALAYPAIKGNDETMVSAAISLVSELWVKVPLPGKYAEVRQLITTKDDAVEFVVTVLNRGELGIEGVSGEISILENGVVNSVDDVMQDGEEITVITTKEQSLAKQENAKLRAVWDEGVTPGVYFARTEILYDDKKVALQDSFQVGKPFLQIEEINVQDFSLGDIAVMDITLLSDWNKELPVSADIMVRNQEGKQIAMFSTAQVSIPPRGRDVLKAYWDTAAISPGTYTLEVTLNYLEFSTVIAIETEVTESEIVTEYMAGMREVSREKPASFFTSVLAPVSAYLSSTFSSPSSALLWSLIIMLVLGNFLFLGYVLISRMKKPPQ